MAFPQMEVLNTTVAMDITSGVSGTSSDNIWDLTFTDSTTAASGYSHGIHLTYTKSGTTTGSGCSVSQFNAIGIDETISGGGGASGYYGFYIYAAKSGSPDLSSSAIFGANLEMTEMGATDYFGGLWINKYNTTKGSIDAFILLSNQGSGVTRTCLYVQGDKPDYFLQTANFATDNMLETGDITSGKSCTGGLRCYFATTVGVIPFYAD